ncbi:lipopolysaccharide biosynthesis protein [Halomonas mongoliensis]|uniref:lipopolysaccharide biosynthesis protein n=1 Tax=Halomonas mongoliensis TaxID=321265 RepID=UPI00403AD81B
MPVDGVPSRTKAPLYKRLQRRFFNGEASRVFRGMAVLAAGSSLAKLVGLVSIPLITRLYAPEDFGVMAVYTALIAMLLPLMTLRYALALPLPQHDGIAMNIMVLSAGILLAFGIALTVILAVFSAPLLGLLSMEFLIPWWWLIILGLLGAGIYELLTFWATRKRDYKIIARTNVTQSLAGNGVKIGLGLLIAGPLGLLVGQLVSKSGGIGTMLHAFLTDFSANWRHVRYRRMVFLSKHYATFPLYRVPSQFLLAFAMQAPVFFIASNFSTAEAGQFALAMTVIALPVTLVAQSAGKAFLGEAAKAGAKDQAKLRRMTVDVIQKTSLMSLIPAIVLFWFGEILFTLVFGDNWQMAGLFASYLSIYLFFHFISNPIQHVFQVVGRNDLYFQQVLRRAIMIVCVFTASYLLGLDAASTVLIYALVMSIHYGIVCVIALRTVGWRFHETEQRG